MRKDFTLDNKAVELPFASTLGFNKRICKRGDWLGFRTQPNAPLHYGRSMGRVRAVTGSNMRMTTLIYVIALTSDLTDLMVRWVNPEDVVFCKANQPTVVGTLIGLDMQDKEAIEKAVNPHLSERLQFGTTPWRKTK